MGRISATFKNTIECATMAYAKENDISFSEAVEMITGSVVLEWWRKLPRIKKIRYEEMFSEKLSKGGEK